VLPIIGRDAKSKPYWLSRILLAAEELHISCGGQERSKKKADFLEFKVGDTWEDKSECLERLQHAFRIIEIHKKLMGILEERGSG